MKRRNPVHVFDETERTPLVSAFLAQDKLLWITDLKTATAIWDIYARQVTYIWERISYQNSHS